MKTCGFQTFPFSQLLVASHGELQVKTMNKNKIKNYTILAGSVGIIGGIVHQADATISHTTVNGGTGLATTPYGYLSFDFDTGAYKSGNDTTYDVRFGSTSINGNNSDNLVAYFSGSDSKILASGETIDGSLTFKQLSNTDSHITNSGTDYLGFSITRSSQTHYGWARVSRNGNVKTLFEFAWNQTAGEAINAGQTVVPEPAESVVMMAAGAAGLVALRKRRNIKKTA